MHKALPAGQYRTENASLAGSEFVDTSLEGAKFHDVNLRHADFADVAFTGATIRNACLGDVTIADANYTGMRIEGILVTDLLRAFQERSGAVVYAKDLARVSAFYASVPGFTVTHAEPDHVVLESPALQLVIVAIPEHIAATIEVADPPVRRADTPIKLVFTVTSIEELRATASARGGQLDTPEREWQFQGYRVCDGHDPEGNVVQFRERVR
jgi:predicted enzyme related to lactoylglutathione lyase